MLSLNCKTVQHVEIYPPCNFEVNPITLFGVISLLSSNLKFFNTFRPLFQKLYETDGKLKLQTYSVYQDLPTLQFWSKSNYPSWSYCPFFIIFFLILILFVLYFNQRLSRACIVHLVIKKTNWSYVKTMSCVILELRST
jgi:hypothetical protein